MENTNNVSEKFLMTVKEAGSYFGLGVNKIRALAQENELLAVRNGRKLMIKRLSMEKFLTEAYSI